MTLIVDLDFSSRLTEVNGLETTWRFVVITRDPEKGYGTSKGECEKGPRSLFEDPINSELALDSSVIWEFSEPTGQRVRPRIAIRHNTSRYNRNYDL